jgi:hypothetical protein
MHLIGVKGDMQAMKLCIERLLPPVRERPCSFRLPKLETLNDESNALAMIIAGVTTGELLPHEAELSNIVNSFMKPIELRELESRLVALEAAAGATSGSATSVRFDA